LVSGALHLQPRPRPKHARASSSLGYGVGGPFDYDPGGPGGWWILDEPELHLGEDVLVPDLAGWRRERMPALPEEAFFSLPPDWASEVLSPSTRDFDLTEKRRVYADHGVPWLWFVDPDARTLEVFELVAGAWTLRLAEARDAEVRAQPFDAITLSLSPLWAESGA
jgi:Uma2 family endonuclease